MLRARRGAGAAMVAPALGVVFLAGCQEPVEPLHEVKLDAVVAGAFHSCGLAPDGTAYCWGSNSSGQLGIGSSRLRARSPQPVAGSVRFLSLSAGEGHTCGVSTAGTPYCWGRNDFGQLGDGTRGDRDVPVPVAGVFGGGAGPGALGVSAGRAHTCAVAADRTAYCWGANENGELGDGTTRASERPVPVAGGLRFFEVNAGGYHSCGVARSNAIYCWGGRGRAELGNGRLLGSPLPVPVAPVEAYAAVSAGRLYTCAVLSPGEARCWGENEAGQLGDGTRMLRGNPTSVAGGLRFTAVAAGPGEATCGVAGDRTAYCWGKSEGMRDPDGGSLDSAWPVPVPGAVRFAGVSVGVGHACGMGLDGIAYCWGLGGSGQLGDGAGEDRTEPVAVAGQR